MKQMSIFDVLRDETWIEIDVDTLKRALKRKKLNEKTKESKRLLKERIRYASRPSNSSRDC